jgi:phthiocerol/phenolphthiocerol synthesis type-I polyketide synthase E
VRNCKAWQLIASTKRAANDQGKDVTADPITRQSSPQTAIREDQATEQLAHIWQELLGIESIGLDENYFDLGGDSILAVQLFAQIQRVFKVKLSLATLFEAPTIQELAQILRHETPTSGWSPLVPIQPRGSRPPFFCMHGAGGNVLIYRDLSQHLGPDQPFYGLQARGLDGTSQPLTTIEDMAALYVREIQRLRSHGPYFLGGYCGGGTIAFEVAQQLLAKGEHVALLALFDTLNWYKIPPLSTWRWTYYYIERIVFHAANFLRLDSEGRKEFLREKLKALRNRIPVWRGMLLATLSSGPDDTKSESRQFGKIWQTNDRACMHYVPKPFPGAVTDFRPLRQYRSLNVPGTKWDGLALVGEEIVVLPVYPAGMLVKPFVRHLAVGLARSIDNALSGLESMKQPRATSDCENGL